MTKEIGEIIKAFKKAQQEGRRSALATVVQVEGSSYRMPGARMLVEDDGRITGAISGGCLEGDALRKALQAIHTGQNKLVTYNTLHDDDREFGVQLGCNGVVHILFEPIDAEDANHPVAILEHLFTVRKEAVLVTLFSVVNSYGPQPGTCFCINSDTTIDRMADTALAAAVKTDAQAALLAGTAMIKEYEVFGLNAFIELLRPAVSLVIAGAGNDVQPLVSMAAILGWHTTVADGRSTHATVRRFPLANKVIAAKPADVMRQLVPDEHTVFVLMTHNYNYDLDMLRLLLQLNCRYIGTLGPRRRLASMLTTLHDEGMHITEQQKAMIYGPVGLDIGAESPEEIALCILAEIKAVLAGHSGGQLRLRQSPIHQRPALPVAGKAYILHHAR